MEFERSASLMRALSLLVKLATATLVILILSRAQAVLLPIACALVLSFILTAPMKWLLHRGVPKAISLTLVMLLALGALGGTGYVLAIQFSDLTTQLSKY